MHVVFVKHLIKGVASSMVDNTALSNCSLPLCAFVVAKILHDCIQCRLNLLTGWHDLCYFKFILLFRYSAAVSKVVEKDLWAQESFLTWMTLHWLHLMFHPKLLHRLSRFDTFNISGANKFKEYIEKDKLLWLWVAKTTCGWDQYKWRLMSRNCPWDFTD